MPRLLLILILLTVATACQTSERPQGREGTVGTYSLGTTSVRLSGPVRIEAVTAAANAALRARGYAVESSTSTADGGRITARRSGTPRHEYMVIDVRPQAGGVEIDVSEKPFGNEDRSRGVMDGILERLGL